MLYTGDVKLTYIGKWDYVIPTVKNEAIKKFYVAPGRSCDPAAMSVFN